MFWTQVFLFVKSIPEIPFTLKHKCVCLQVVYMHFGLRMLGELAVCKLKNVCTCFTLLLGFYFSGTPVRIEHKL